MKNCTGKSFIRHFLFRYRHTFSNRSNHFYPFLMMSCTIRKYLYRIFHIFITRKRQKQKRYVIDLEDSFQFIMESDQPNHKIRVHCNNRFYVDIVHISHCLFSPCPCRFFYTRIISPCFKITIYSKKNFRKSSRQKHYPFWLLFQFHCTPRAVNYLIKSRSFGNFLLGSTATG